MLVARRTTHGFCALVLALTISAQLTIAHVHHDADGRAVTWYPRDCCGEGDCKPVAEVQRVGAGLWLKTADGLAMFVDPQEPRHHSKDSRWHICVRFDYEAQAFVLHCIFEPNGTALRVTPRSPYEQN